MAGLGPEILAKPIENRIFFAGEATNPIHYATVHGAIESGYRAADEILAERAVSLKPVRELTQRGQQGNREAFVDLKE